MLDQYNLRCVTYGSGRTYVQVRSTHPAMMELRDAGCDISRYAVQPGTGEPFGRPEIRLVPMEEWDGIAAAQRGHDQRPFRLPTLDDQAEDVGAGLYDPEIAPLADDES